MEPLPSTLHPHNSRNGTKELIETSETLRGYASSLRDEELQHLKRNTAQAGSEESDAALPRSLEASGEVSKTPFGQHGNTGLNYIQHKCGAVERPAAVAGYELPVKMTCDMRPLQKLT
jgi:hypothetical protein